MKAPPKPSGIKTEAPPPSNTPGNPAFTYKPEKQKPTLEETNPIAASLLHIFVITLLGLIAFSIGGFYFLVRAKGGGTTGSAILLILIGGAIGLTYLYKLCKTDS